jgi:hypothetical protein
MAGSWRYATTERGKLLNNENFIGMVENLGDAYETVEEMFGMIWTLAGRLAVQLTAGTGVTPNRAYVLDLIRQAEANYEHGLRIGGRQRER